MLLHTTPSGANQTIDYRPLAARPESITTRMQAYEPDERLVPRPVWQRIRPTVLDIVGRATPRNGLDAKGLLGPLTQFLAWRVLIGDAIDELPESLTEENIARFVSEILSPDLRPGTKGNYRTWLRRCAEAVQPTGRPFRPTGLHGAAPLHPYSTKQMTGWKHWAHGLNTERRRDNALTLLGLAHGGGFEANDLRLTRGNDVERRRTATLVHIRVARTPRTVPITAEWAHVVAAAAARAGDDYLFVPGRTPANRNVVTHFLARLPKLNGEVLSASRLRTTWIVNHLNAQVPLPALLEAAGLTSFGSLDRYRGFLNPSTTDQAIDALSR